MKYDSCYSSEMLTLQITMVRVLVPVGNSVYLILSAHYM